MKKILIETVSRIKMLFATVVWFVVALMVFNPLIYAVAVFFMPKCMTKFAYYWVYMYFPASCLWEMLVSISFRVSQKSKFWMHVVTKCKYADIKTQVGVLMWASDEDVISILSGRHINRTVLKQVIWLNPKHSNELRLQMLKYGYQHDIGDFNYALNSGYVDVVKKIASQTLPDTYVLLFWDKVQIAEGEITQELLREFTCYVTREGLTEKAKAYIEKSADTISKKLVKNALKDHDEMLFIRHAKDPQLLEEYFKRNTKLCLPAEKELKNTQYAIFKKCGGVLSDEGVKYHLENRTMIVSDVISKENLSNDNILFVSNYPDLLKMYKKSER